jgi:hypothetical protein
MDTNSTDGSNPNPAEAVTATETTTQDQKPTAAEGTEGQEKGGTEAAATDKEKTESTEDKDPAEAEGAPEQYEAFTLPDGYTLEGERLEMAVEKFKELNLPQDKAQGLIDLYVKADSENAEARNVLLGEARAQQIEEWGNEARTKLGDKFDAAVADAAYAASLVGDPEVVEAFEQMGWGNHPAMLKAFAHFGSLFKENGMDGVGGGRGGGGDKPLSNRMYPNM